MVNTAGKDITYRYALAAGKVHLGPKAYELVKQNKLKKGNVLTVAQLAGVSAADASAIPPGTCGLLQQQSNSMRQASTSLALFSSLYCPGGRDFSILYNSHSQPSIGAMHCFL